MPRLLLLCFLMLPFAAAGQDTLSILYYNVLNYPGDEPERADTLRRIVDYYQPDLVLINELETEAGADLLLNGSFNANGATNWARANFTNGFNTENMLFYNTDKVGLKSNTVVPTGRRDINEYIVYSKHYLPALTDTIFLRMYSLHLKSSQGATNELQRAEEAGALRQWLNARPPENVIVGGDFNIYNSFEIAYDTLLNTGSFKLFDPLASPGSWHSNAFHAHLHTQSTRTSALSDGSGGGLDDRFDIILASGDVMIGNNSVRYIPGTYIAPGNDGAHYNDGIDELPNGDVPDSIALALFYMSDHLPVIMQVEIDTSLAEPVSIAEPSNEQRIWVDANRQRVVFEGGTTKAYTARIVGMDGKVSAPAIQIPMGAVGMALPGLAAGNYVLQLQGTKQTIAKKFAVR